jgi:hypothetical protein
MHAYSIHACARALCAHAYNGHERNTFTRTATCPRVHTQRTRARDHAQEQR